MIAYNKHSLSEYMDDLLRSLGGPFDLAMIAQILATVIQSDSDEETSQMLYAASGDDKVGSDLVALAYAGAYMILRCVLDQRLKEALSRFGEEPDAFTFVMLEQARYILTEGTDDACDLQ